MEIESENPALVYEGDDSLAPLIMPHDGGGTTFSYHCLEPINRTIYAISNPRLLQGGFWDGGIPEMATHYIELIGKVIPQGGDIILAGWSFGGSLSVEMAYQIARGPPAGSSAPRFRVLGLILIDCVCTRPPERYRAQQAAVTLKRVDPVVKTPEELKTMTLKEKVDLNALHGRMLSARWQMPTWGNLSMPSMILLRARDPVELEEHLFIDYARDDHYLGWSEYFEANGGTIQSVVEVDGHHFSIFEFQRIEDITAKIEQAADFFNEPED